MKRTWTVELKDGTRVHTGDYDVDVEGGALTFRDVDGEVVHAYGQWRECHLDQGAGGEGRVPVRAPGRDARALPARHGLRDQRL